MADTSRMSDLAKVWAPLLGEKPTPKIPKNFHTIEEIAEAMEKSAVHTANQLRGLLKKKKITRLKGRNSNGRVCWFYGVKQ